MKRCCPNPRCQSQCPEYANNCPHCGTPLRVPNGSKDCRPCGGTGWADGPVQLIRCKSCHGTGRV